jgi:hypothetical protein
MVGYFLCGTGYFVWIMLLFPLFIALFGTLASRMFEPETVGIARRRLAQVDRKWSTDSRSKNSTAPSPAFTIYPGKRTEEVESLDGKAIWIPNKTWVPNIGRIGYVFGAGARHGNPDPFPLYGAMRKEMPKRSGNPKGSRPYNAVNSIKAIEAFL